MGSSNVLSPKDANNNLKNQTGTGAGKSDVKSMEYHRQVLKSKMEEEKYGHTTITTITTTTTTTKNTIIPGPPATATITITTTTGASTSGPDTTPATSTSPSATIIPGITTSTATSLSQMPSSIRHWTISRIPADPKASGTYSSAQQYVSPSDDIMSPCTAKLNALKSRQVGKAKPKSLFAQASAKRFVGENVLGARNAEKSPSSIKTTTITTTLSSGDVKDQPASSDRS